MLLLCFPTFLVALTGAEETNLLKITYMRTGTRPTSLQKLLSLQFMEIILPGDKLFYSKLQIKNIPS